MKHFLIAVFLLAGTLTQISAVPAYIVREKNGHAAYFDTQNGILQETDFHVCSLPNPADRALLRMGIPAESDAELTQILEDFCS